MSSINRILRNRAAERAAAEFARAAGYGLYSAAYPFPWGAPLWPGLTSGAMTAGTSTSHSPLPAHVTATPHLTGLGHPAAGGSSSAAAVAAAAAAAAAAASHGHPSVNRAESSPHQVTPLMAGSVLSSPASGAESIRSTSPRDRPLSQGEFNE